MEKPADAADVRPRVGSAAACRKFTAPSRFRSAARPGKRCWPSRGRATSWRSATWIPGNWATDIAGGAKFGYTLLSVIVLSNFMAILLQSLSARLGIASGRDLAQACRDAYSHAHDVRPVDPLRDRDCRLRPRRSARRRHRAAAAVRHPAALGRVPDGDRRVPGAVPAEPRLPLRRSDRADADSRHRRLLCDRAVDGAARSDRRWPPASIPRVGDSAESGDALHLDRHPRRDGDAAQPVPALVDRADAHVRRFVRGQEGSDPLRDDRLDRRADVGAVHQRRDSHHGRGGVQSRPAIPGGRRHRRRVPAARTRCSARRSRARCLPWRCCSRGRTPR